MHEPARGWGTRSKGLAGRKHERAMAGRLPDDLLGCREVLLPFVPAGFRAEYQHARLKIHGSVTPAKRYVQVSHPSFARYGLIRHWVHEAPRQPLPNVPLNSGGARDFLSDVLVRFANHFVGLPDQNDRTSFPPCVSTRGVSLRAENWRC